MHDVMLLAYRGVPWKRYPLLEVITLCQVAQES
jgi:hypothetical protein